MRATGRALFGVVLAAVPTLTYFRFWAKEVVWGEREWPLWIAIAAGIAIAFAAVVRTPRVPRRTDRADRFIAGLCLTLAVGVGGLFFWYTRVFSYVLPPVAESSCALGREFPDVPLKCIEPRGEKDVEPNPAGADFNLLAESREGGRLHGKKVLLSFFRGFW